MCALTTTPNTGQQSLTTEAGRLPSVVHLRECILASLRSARADLDGLFLGVAVRAGAVAVAGVAALSA
jgi:hypothetical protein